VAPGEGVSKQAETEMLNVKSRPKKTNILLGYIEPPLYLKYSLCLGGIISYFYRVFKNCLFVWDNRLMKKQLDFITLEGRNMVHDALLSGQKIASVLLASSTLNDPRIKEIENLARKNGVSVQKISPEEIGKMSDSRNPQGVIALMSIPETPTLEQILIAKRNAFILLLNHIDYEQNLGAILRTAWAAGVDAVVASPNGVHEVTPVVAKVSMGGAAYVPLLGMSMFQAIKLLHKYAVPVVGVEVGMGKAFTETALKGPVAFVMGGEAVGLSEPLQKECDWFVNIPMEKAVASLNVSVATALILFEKLRQEKE
jgi:23S rRNA (guanosine2251-2'-O)-methyltransferase